MFGLKITLLLGHVAVFAGRSVTIQSNTSSSVEASKEELTNFWNTIFGDTYCGVVDVCIKGKCFYCKDEIGHVVCFVATLENGSVVLDVIFDKHHMMQRVIKDNNPREICPKPIPDSLSVTNLCIQIKNVNLQRASGCIFAAFKNDRLASLNTLGLFEHFNFTWTIVTKNDKLVKVKAGSLNITIPPC